MGFGKKQEALLPVTTLSGSKYVGHIALLFGGDAAIAAYACVSESVLKRLVVRYDAVVEDDFALAVPDDVRQVGVARD
ncbi:hypothetical protein SAMN05216403_1468, partial [Nitrosospira multiformis ATCC 25196]